MPNFRAGLHEKYLLKIRGGGKERGKLKSKILILFWKFMVSATWLKSKTEWDWLDVRLDIFSPVSKAFYYQCLKYLPAK